MKHLKVSANHLQDRSLINIKKPDRYKVQWRKKKQSLRASLLHRTKGLDYPELDYPIFLQYCTIYTSELQPFELDHAEAIIFWEPANASEPIHKIKIQYLNRRHKVLSSLKDKTQDIFLKLDYPIFLRYWTIYTWTAAFRFGPCRNMGKIRTG